MVIRLWLDEHELLNRSLAGINNLFIGQDPDSSCVSHFKLILGALLKSYNILHSVHLSFSFIKVVIGHLQCKEGLEQIL